MRKPYLLFPLFFIGFLLLGGWVVMLLWNAILPDVLSVKPLAYWQALGMLLLSRILFGNMGGPRGRWGKPARGEESYWQMRRQRREQWLQMSESEREAFRDAWKSRCKKK